MDELARAHTVAMAVLRDMIVRLLRGAWDGLPAYNEDDVARWLAQAVPILDAGQRQAVSLTDAYLARAMERQPLGIDPALVTGAAVRAGTTPEEEWRRPFVTLWTALSRGVAYEQAVRDAWERADAMAQLDVQLSMRATAREIGLRDDGIFGWRRVTDGNACELCQIASTQRYHRGDLMPIHARCVVGSTVVWSGSATPPAGGGSKAPDVGGAHAVTRRWYSGEVVSIRTAAGHELTVTPNHPVLTDAGWVEAGMLQEGDDVVSSRRPDGVVGHVPDEHDMPARIEDRFRAGRVNGLVSVPFAAEHFHGDIGDGQVDVVPADGDLEPRVLAALAQPVEHRDLTGALRGGRSLAGLCAQHASVFRLWHAALRGVCCSGPRAALVGALALRGEPVLFGGIAHAYAGLAQRPLDDRAACADAVSDRQYRLARKIGGYNTFGGETPSARGDAAPAHLAQEGRLADADSGRRLLRGLAGQIELDRLVEVRRRDFSGHVYNLVTRDGWYSANAILTHNCGCTVAPLTSPSDQIVDRSLYGELKASGAMQRRTAQRQRARGEEPLVAAVRRHGELGPVLVNARDHFTTAAEIAA